MTERDIHRHAIAALLRRALPLLPLLLALSACTAPPGAPDQPIAQAPDAFDPGRFDTTLGRYGEAFDRRLLLVTMEPQAHRRLLNDVPGSAAETEASALPTPYADFLDALETRYGIRRVADWPLTSIGVRCLVFSSDGSKPMHTILTALRTEPEVESAQAVQRFDARAAAYDDPYLHLQSGFLAVHADASHQWSTGAGVRVAIIDTGMDVRHPELVDAVAQVANFVDQDTARFEADEHGTAVAGIISAAANNTTGLVGIAPDATVLALKACWSETAGSHASCNSYTLAKALNVAIREEADVINLSLAGPRDALLERLVDEAAARGIVIIGARDPVDPQNFPAALHNVIAASLPHDASVSSVGAPGSNVISTAPGNRYDFYTGSSFSTAHLSGVVALLRQLDPTLDHTRIRALLASSRNATSDTLDACVAVAQLAIATGATSPAKSPDCGQGDT